MKQTIYLDIDGVLASFSKGYKQAFNRDAYHDDSFTVTQFCLQIPHFFRMLPVNGQGFELFHALKDNYDIKMLTTPMEGMTFCKRDKILWCIEHFGNYDVIFSDDKAEYVIDEKSILIDDMDYNLKPWSEAGGTGILFPQKIDKILEKIDNVFNPKEESKIKKQLKEMIVELNPSEKQKEVGNYKKSEIIDFKGLKIKIENPKGSIRWGFDESGKKWISRMNAHYGYITGTDGNDCDPIDCFIGNKINASRVFVVNQGKDGMFDEHKIMLGYDDIESAEKAYMNNYQKNWDGLMSIKQTNTKKIREWLQEASMREPFK